MAAAFETNSLSAASQKQLNSTDLLDIPLKSGITAEKRANPTNPNGVAHFASLNIEKAQAQNHYMVILTIPKIEADVNDF